MQVGCSAEQSDVMAAATGRLGFGDGSLIDHGDGAASYRPTGALNIAFRVNVADITGFAVHKPEE
jgi:hypothetical protein